MNGTSNRPAMQRTLPRMTRGHAARRALGFTLLELLIAITVLSVVSLIAWRGLDTLLATRARLEPEADDARALLTTFGQLERDLANAINAKLMVVPVEPVGVISVDGAPALSITRLAPQGTDDASALQIVGYRVADGVLLRTASPPLRVVGPLNLEQMSNTRLLSGVKSLRLRLWREGTGWIDPLSPDAPTAPPAASTGASVQTYPGVEFIIERVDGKTYRRVALVG
jgi:general secretion pathway protein J